MWKGGEAGEPSWDEPVGRRPPGLAHRVLGDEHALPRRVVRHPRRRLDLVFPHHENESRASEAATGKPLSRLWVHHGFVEVKNEKMSKSLGNFLTARDCFRLAEPEALRGMMLTAHYRAPLGIEWSTGADGVIDGCPQLDEAERRVEYIYRTHQRLAAIPAARVGDGGEMPPELSGFAQRFLHALDDDLNMPLALAAAAELLKAVNDLAERAKGKKGAGAAPRARQPRVPASRCSAVCSVWATTTRPRSWRACASAAPHASASASRTWSAKSPSASRPATPATSPAPTRSATKSRAAASS